MWRGIMLLSLAATPLSACASLSSAPASCDGLARRPLNRSLWDWENASAPARLFPQSAANAHIDQTPRVLNGTAETPNAAAQPPRLDFAASSRPCRGEG
jgi:type IV secretion system protein VirB7